MEARKLTRNTGVVVQTAVGGNSKAAGLRAIKTQGCHILVGTPGRLNDILSDPYSQVRAPDLSAFVLDEADRLLDQGFAPEIQAIQQLLPKRKEVDRQTLLFSATIPREVVSIVRQTAKPDVQFVRTVQEGEQQTHEKVPQKMCILRGLENQSPALIEFCKRELARTDGSPFKAIIYLNATADVSFMASTLKNLKNPGESIYHKHPLDPARIIEIHARLTQRERTFAADSFRKADSAIMVSSDVTARGMDFPNVTHIIQVGIPANRDTYIHRIGRTGRADKTGAGWLFLTATEAREASYRLKDLPITADHSIEAAKVDMTQDAQLPEHVAKTLTQAIDASRMVSNPMKFASYMAALGTMSWAPKKYVIENLNRRARYCWGLETPPRISPFLARKLGLTDVPGVEIGADDRREANSTGGRGGSFGDRVSSRGGYPSASSDRDDRGGFGGSRERFDRGADRGARDGGFNRGDRGGRFGGGDGFNLRGRTRDADPASRYDRTERSGGFGQYPRRDRGFGAAA